MSYKVPIISIKRIPDIVLFLSSSDGGSSSNGQLLYAYYEGTFNKLPNFGSLSPKKTGSVDNFTLSPRSRNDQYAFEFEGSISILTSGTYTFYTSSDDGSKLYIDGSLVVNNDGLHGTQERSVQKYLVAGNHSIKVTYFERYGNATLSVSYKGPNISKKRIPDNILSGANARTEVAGKQLQTGEETPFGSTVENSFEEVVVYPNPADQYLRIGNATNSE